MASMAPKRRSSRDRQPPARRAQASANGAAAAPPAWPRRLALAAVGAAVVVTPAVYDIASRDPFRLPKALFFELAALASLFLLSLGWKRADDLRRLLRAPVVVAIAPFVIAATLMSLLSPHREHVLRAFVGLWISAAALWGWSAGFSRRELDRALGWLLLPAAALGLIGILQFHDLYQPFAFQDLTDASRLAITSLAGNAGDLAAFLVLPALVAQRALALGSGRAWAALALAISFYGLAVTQTFAAAAALAVGTLLFWGTLLPVRRRFLALGGAIVVVLLTLAVSAPFRARAVEKSRELARGDLNEVLTGRLDGWRAGLWMLRENPATGVGVGAFRAEFLTAKEALVDRGVEFFGQQKNVVFANAHNEAIEVGAELGLPGLLALAWAIFHVARRTAALPGGGGGSANGDRTFARAVDRGFAWAALAALATLSLFHFPFRIAIVSSGALLFLAWLYSGEEESA